jgi:hypothetical protein
MIAALAAVSMFGFYASRGNEPIFIEAQS